MSKRNMIFDRDNPEWTESDFARAQPVSEFPELAEAFAKAKGGRPKGSNKEQAALRLDRDLLEKLRALGCFGPWLADAGE